MNLLSRVSNMDYLIQTTLDEVIFNNVKQAVDSGAETLIQRTFR